MYTLYLRLCHYSVLQQWNSKMIFDHVRTVLFYIHCVDMLLFSCTQVKFFKPLPLKILFGADFVSVFPLNILHFEEI